MIFRDVEFPRCVSMGAQVNPGWSTALAVTAAGWESANQNWAQARSAYEVGLAVRTSSDYAAVRAHFHSVRGRAYSFPFEDPLDHEVDGADGILIDAGSSPAGLFRLGKRYGELAFGWERRITRPKPTPAPTIYRTRSSVTSDATGDATIDFETGMVDMAGHQPGDIYAWEGEFWTPCRYDTDRLPSVIVNREPGTTGELLVECASIQLLEVRER